MLKKLVRTVIVSAVLTLANCSGVFVVPTNETVGAQTSQS